MPNLAINGGDKVFSDPLKMEWPIFGEEEEKRILEVLHSGKWWRGAYSEAEASQVGTFENAFSDYHNAKHGTAVANGTVALECALRALDLEPGDEVLVPALTFVASATAIAYMGFIPKFVDIDPETYNISPAAMEAAISDRTKAAIVVHNGGYPVDFDSILEIARNRGIKVIEDCAHAHGSAWKGTRVGALGDAGTFSFQMGKTLTCGEGGIILTNDDDLAEKIFSIHHIGRIPGRPFYEFHRIGSNLRMTEWQGAMLNTQFARFDEQIRRREQNATHLARMMSEVDGVRPIARDERVTQWGFYYWNFHYDQDKLQGLPKEKFLKAANAEGLPIGNGAHGGPIYQNPVFQNMKTLAGQPVDFTGVRCEEAERVSRDQSLSLTHKAFLGDESDMERIAAVFEKIQANVSELL